MTPHRELLALKRSVRELEGRFLSPHLEKDGLAPARDEILDVAAYVVLTHGAIENFVEGIALWVLQKAVTNFTTRGRVSRATAAIMLYQDSPSCPEIFKPVFDQLREAVDVGNDSRSASIFDNNGISPKNLRQLFYPLGVNVPADPVLTGSLELVIKMRHEWAHQYRFARGARVVRSAKDIRMTVEDCIKFAQELSIQATAIRP